MIASRHFLRRTARAKARRLEHATGIDHTVTRATRGPYRWYVTRP